MVKAVNTAKVSKAKVKYTVRLAQTHYYDVVVSAEGVADARKRAKEWAGAASPDGLEDVRASIGSFEAERASKVPDVVKKTARKTKAATAEARA